MAGDEGLNRILAIESSGARVSVATISSNGDCLAEAARVSQRGHVRFLSVLVAEALEGAFNEGWRAYGESTRAYDEMLEEVADEV